MKADAGHIKQIKVVSNTHWDREFRFSFEKTRRRLLTMLDTTLDILATDPAYHSFTMDGHCIMIEDYLDIKPERRELVERLISEGRLIIGPYFTLEEEFSLCHEPIVRNLLWGRKLMDRYHAPHGTVAYTPNSWGQTGQLPQILADFGLDKMMFYRGFSHHEADAEWIWQGVDGTRMLASRFALYARYNWYYQVHRAVTTGRVFSKDYLWGERDEVPFRFADGMAGEDLAFVLQAPALNYDRSRLKSAIMDMVAAEGPHFTTEVFLAMHGHDISVAHPREAEIISDASEDLAGIYTIEHTNLEEYWKELEKHLEQDKLPVLSGERRSYLKEGKWTFLMPATISARTYLKQQDFEATNRLVYLAEPLASLAKALGAEYPTRFLDRGWHYLLSNHTHDANGGCAPDQVCKDMEYRYRKAVDLADIASEDAMAYIAKELSPADLPTDTMQLIVYNSLPFKRNAVMALDLEVANTIAAKSLTLEHPNDPAVECQFISCEKSGSFVDSIWDVPTIVDSTRMKLYARMSNLPALGYRVYKIVPQADELRTPGSLVTGPQSMENAFLRVTINSDGTVDLLDKNSGRLFSHLNYLSDAGETGNAWNHVPPQFDRVYNSLGVAAQISIVESGLLAASFLVEYRFPVPVDYADGTSRSKVMVDLPVQVEYRLEKDARLLQVKLTVDNRAQDHWLRANFPTGLQTDSSWADSHFDVVERPIPLPDSTGWVEQAWGTHPLRTFVDLSNGNEGLALLPKGIYEYEAFDDEQRTLALTLIRACRIKLAVSEEKKAELPDEGVQCPGVRTFYYAICPHRGDWQAALLPRQAAEYFTPVRAAMSGRGQGKLPDELALLTLDNSQLHISCIKEAEDGSGMLVRLFNPTAENQTATLILVKPPMIVMRCRMDESDIEPVAINDNRILLLLEAKKIYSYKIIFEK